MFTGLIEETGVVANLTKTAEGAMLTITSDVIAVEAAVGDSVTVNGVCSTIVKKNGNSFNVEFSNQTLSLTNLGDLKSGIVVNLERALRLSDRLDGHLVSGHIDGLARLVNISKEGFSHKYTFSAKSELLKYMIDKGSVAINGISLTICDISSESFTVNIIPHTIENTNLRDLRAGASVNIEVDMVGKYIEKFLLTNDNKSVSRTIDEQFLYEKGFL